MINKEETYYSWFWENEVPNEVCQRIIGLGEKKWKSAGIITAEKTQSLNNIRKSDIVWINEHWVNDLIWNFMITANENAGWKYDIKAIESCQLTRYSKGGFYSWHVDSLGTHRDMHDNPKNKSLHGNTRKLSMSIFLNSDYEGGAFEFADGEMTDLGTGSVVVFPSFLIHKVSPITKGIRYSLVAWFVCPPFK